MLPSWLTPKASNQEPFNSTTERHAVLGTELHAQLTTDQEAAIFAFSKNYFKNEELALHKGEQFQIEHKDEEIARELISNHNY